METVFDYEQDADIHQEAAPMSALPPPSLHPSPIPLTVTDFIAQNALKVKPHLETPVWALLRTPFPNSFSLNSGLYPAGHQFLMTMILKFCHASYSADDGLLKTEASEDADCADPRQAMKICISLFASNADDSSQSHTQISNDLESMP